MSISRCFTQVAEVHASVGAQSEQYYVVEKRYNYVTPTSFLELISFYKSLLAERRQEMSNQIERLATGLQTLKNTNKDVTALKEDLKIKMIDVNAKKADCDVFLEKMGEQRAIAEGEQDAAKVVQGRADAAAQDARKIEESAASDLAVAQPALHPRLAISAAMLQTRTRPYPESNTSLRPRETPD